MRRARKAALSRDRRGATLVEFAMVAPVLLIGIMALTEMCYQLYLQSALEGAVQKAARDSTIQGGGDNTGAIDQIVKNQVLAIAPKASFVSDRKNYDTYKAIAAEPFVDATWQGAAPDGICNHGETFTDVNNNQKYDLDPGIGGQGGASDDTRYTMTVTYPRLMPVAMFGWTASNTISATTILENQPYATQSTMAAESGTCP